MASSEPIEILLGRRLAERGATLGTAESCSGGLIAHRITNVSGASKYFLGGIVAYSNQAKVQFLGVSAEMLAAYGAVSEPVAQQMAEGARARFASDYAIAVTGVAGPTGGSATKPVGLVFIAVAREGETRVERHQFSGSREQVKQQTSDVAMSRLWEWLA